jgi:hypothetical protein
MTREVFAHIEDNNELGMWERQDVASRSYKKEDALISPVLA